MPLRRNRAVALLPALCAVVPTVASVSFFAFARETYCPGATAALIVISLVIAWLVHWPLSSLAVWGVTSLGTKNKQARFCSKGGFVIANVLMATLCAFPWTPRQEFFARVNSLRAGMSVAEAEKTMGRYHVVYSHQFDGNTGPSARPLPSGFKDGVVYVRDNDDPVNYKDKAGVGFKSGRLEYVWEVSD